MNARCWLANVVRGGRIAFEGLVHALVGAIRLRLRGPDALELDAEPQPPDVELREAVDARGGEGDPVVGANGMRQAVVTEETLEDGPHAVALGGEQTVAREQVARADPRR